MQAMFVLLLLALAMKVTVVLFPPPGKPELVIVNPFTPSILHDRVTVAPNGVMHENSTADPSLTFFEAGISENTPELVLAPVSRTDCSNCKNKFHKNCTVYNIMFQPARTRRYAHKWLYPRHPPLPPRNEKHSSKTPSERELYCYVWFLQPKLKQTVLRHARAITTYVWHQANTNCAKSSYNSNWVHIQWSQNPAAIRPSSHVLAPDETTSARTESAHSRGSCLGRKI